MLSQRLTPTSDTEHIINVCKLYSPDYAASYDYFKSQGGLNEVLILLCERSNHEAYAKMKQLYHKGDNSKSAKMNYVSAICATRVEDLSMAIYYLTCAIELEPHLAEIAMIDADVNDIYNIIKEMEQNATN